MTIINKITGRNISTEYLALMSGLITNDEFNRNKNKYKINSPLLKESYFYRKIFESHYPDKANIIPYFWLPNWTDEIDPSAREL